jgi:predicted ATPase
VTCAAAGRKLAAVQDTSPPQRRPLADPLYGRDALRRALAALDDAPCVTLVGPGGIGKTSLARAARPEAMFVELSRATTALEMCDAIARAGGFTLEGGGPPAVALARLLDARGLRRLVLDNFEQLEPAAAEAVAELGEALPALRVLITSRQALEVGTETVVEVPGLDVEAATALFLARAGAAGLPPGVTAAETATVARIVAPLEGLPLALELAAARLELLSLDELERLLSQRFAALRDPSAPQDRHGTLWQTIDWSWRLLGPAEQAALSQASVFEAAFGLADAEAVLALPPPPGDAEHEPPLVLDALQSLVRKHLLIATRARPVRFSLAESIRDFAARKLDATTEAGARGRHAAHFLDRAANWAPLAHGPRMREMLDALSALYPELRHIALHGAPAARRAAVHAALAYLGTREPPRVQVALLDAAIDAEAAPEAASERLRLGELLDARGMALRVLGRHDAAEADYACALAVAHALGDLRLEGLAEGRLGALCHARGQYADAAVHLTRAEARLEAAGDRRNTAVMIGAQALLSLAESDFAGAVARCERSLALLAEVGDDRQAGIVHGFLATTLAEHGETRRAREHVEQALARHAAFGNLRPEAVMRGQRGIIAHVEGRLAEAEADYVQACAVFDALGDPRMGGSLRIYRGLLAAELGDTEAPGLLAAGLSRTLAAGDRGFAGIAHAAQAAVPALAGDVPGTEAALSGADAALTHAYGQHVRHLPAVYRALAEAGAAVQATASGEGAEAHRAARATLTTLESLPSFDLALALRLLRAACERVERALTGWHVDRAGRAVRLPSGEVVDLSRRLPLTRLLAALLQARLDGAPGAAIARADLVAAAWPDEPRLRPEAARNRLNVALSTLRGLGLAPLLETAGDGHRLAVSQSVFAFDFTAGASDLSGPDGD